MSNWTDVAPAGEFPVGTHQVVDVEGVSIAVFNVEGTYYAIENICTHDGGTLTGGPVKGCEVTCPRHGARFDVRTGAVLSPPAYEPVDTFPVRLEHNVVQVRDDRWD
ncbi:MAG: non-heme iron oxygenase ferredoxin subunit [Pseudomonadota bacterium]|nr:non-heme iron oxygenase ferredoxin subunit [Pseudomonadota bacterium]